MSIFNQSKNTENGTVEAAQNDSVDKVTHVALGAPAAIADFVNEAIERWKNSSQRDKDLKVLREQLERGIDVAEKRGVEIRQQLPTQVEKGLKVAEKRGGEVSKQVVEQAKTARERFEPTVRKTVTEARKRGSDLTGSTQEQLKKTQERVRTLV